MESGHESGPLRCFEVLREASQFWVWTCPPEHYQPLAQSSCGCRTAQKHTLGHVKPQHKSSWGCRIAQKHTLGHFKPQHKSSWGCRTAQNTKIGVRSPIWALEVLRGASRSFAALGLDMPPRALSSLSSIKLWLQNSSKTHFWPRQASAQIKLGLQNLENQHVELFRPRTSYFPAHSASKTIKMGAGPPMEESVFD